MERRESPLDLVEERVEVAGRTVFIVRPRDSEALLDEEAFEREEFLPYWAELWPSALALARKLARLPIRDALVVELGCGLGLPSIVAALAGARVLATDWAPDALPFVERNAARNGARVETALCDWHDTDGLVARGPFDVALASDVLYERRNAPLLLALVPRLVRAGGLLVLADPGRPAAPDFLAELRRTGELEVERDDAIPRGGVYRLRVGKPGPRA